MYHNYNLKVSKGSAPLCKMLLPGCSLSRKPHINIFCRFVEGDSLQRKPHLVESGGKLSPDVGHAQPLQLLDMVVRGTLPYHLSSFLKVTEATAFSRQLFGLKLVLNNLVGVVCNAMRD